MTGRNNHPDNDGSAATPSRLDQFGKKQQEREKQEMKQHIPEDTCQSGNQG